MGVMVFLLVVPPLSTERTREGGEEERGKKEKGRGEKGKGKLTGRKRTHERGDEKKRREKKHFGCGVNESDLHIGVCLRV